MTGAAAGLCRLLLALLCACLVQARFLVEQGGLKISFPPDAKKQYASGFDMALANFGAPKYGGALMGRLVYVDKEYRQDYVCSPPCKFACQDFASATPKFDLRGGSETHIMMVDRGPVDAGLTACKFAEKVWNAQAAGARGVIVMNYEEQLTTMEAPDGDDESNYRYLANITIPAVFVTRSTADALKSLIKASAGADGVYVSMDWTDALPRQKRVAWEFWTNSNDQCGPICDVQKGFIKEFVPVAKEFDANGWTQFAPHYIVWVCPAAYRGSAECKSQCIRSGRYCSPDPDGSLLEGYSGSDVVQENLRQLCVFRMANESGRPWVWWDYVTRFGEQCSMESKAYGQACAEKVFAQVNADAWSSVAALNACIGAQEADEPHQIMEAQMVAQKGEEAGAEGEVFILPTIRINGAQYRGRMATPDVLRALCAGFSEGNRPPACTKAADDACMEGGKGAAECGARTDGRTACVNTFAGYNCTCGRGFIPHAAPGGAETCLDINECLSVSQLDPNCTCARCACKNTYGGYECVTGLADECAKDNGGCWAADLKVKGKAVHFSACKDNLPAVRDALSHGRPADALPPLHTCACPPCFAEVQRGGGSVHCEPKCDLEYCDLDVGLCHLPGGGGGGKGGLGAGMVVLVVLAVAAALAGGGFLAYRLRLRTLMQAEVRAIMREYMPLGDSEGGGGGRAGGLGGP